MREGGHEGDLRAWEAGDVITYLRGEAEAGRATPSRSRGEAAEATSLTFILGVEI